MDLHIIDFLAHNRPTPMHRYHTVAKLAGGGLTIAALLATGNPYALLIMLGLQGFVLFSSAPVRFILPFAAYPLIFTGLFALSQWRHHPVLALTTVLRGELAAWVVLSIVVTTPFNRVFALLRWTPRVFRDALLLTYRSFFILIERLTSIQTCLKLRGGSGPTGVLRNLKRAGQSFGVMTITAMDMAERMYRVLEIRGYEGVMEDSSAGLGWHWRDIIPIGLGACFVLLGVLL